jgi:hypothetical protein
VPLNANHSNIVRFKSAEDDNFKIVVDKLRHLIENNVKLFTTTRRRHRHCIIFVPFMPSNNFIGRKEELATLKKWFWESGGQTVNVVALHGQSGVGKTQLSLKYAIQNQESYDYVFFVNASTIDTLRTEFVKIRSNLKIADVGGDSITDTT